MIDFSISEGKPTLHVRGADKLWALKSLENAAGTLTTRMEWVLAAALIRRLGTLDVQIHDHGVQSASDNHCFTRDICAGIDFLMWDVGRNVNKIAGVSLIAELQMLAPTHARPTSDELDHCLQLAMMVGTSFGVRLNDYSTGPELTGPDARLRDGGGSRHSRGLGRVGV